MIELYKTFIIKFFDLNNLIIKSMVKFFYEMSNNFIIYTFLYILCVECLFFYHYIHFVI